MAVLSCLSVSANDKLSFKKINNFDKEISLQTDAQIYTLVGSWNNLELKEKRIGKPSKDSLELLKLVTPRDKYAIKVLDDNNREIMLKTIIDKVNHKPILGYRSHCK